MAPRYGGAGANRNDGRGSTRKRATIMIRKMLVDLVVCADIKEDNLILQLHVDHSGITCDREGSSSLQAST
ncbi:hypothetical protein KC867_02370 [Candidatus Saccharibacteria bacterium]|nr:hypothetical protein [Candidatus Saccharibacteria bacterium]